MPFSRQSSAVKVSAQQSQARSSLPSHSALVQPNVVPPNEIPAWQGPPAASSQLRRCLHSPAPPLGLGKLHSRLGSKSGVASRRTRQTGVSLQLFCAKPASTLLLHGRGSAPLLVSPTLLLSICKHISATTQPRLLQNALGQALQGVCG